MTENQASDQSPQPGQSSQPALPTRLTPGQPAPDFTLPAVNPDGGETSVTLSRLLAQGKRVVLYFYPAAMTPGCTTEACDFRDNIARLTALGFTVLGVSKDPIDKLQRFRERDHLSFPLLSDADLTVHRLYGAYGEKEALWAHAHRRDPLDIRHQRVCYRRSRHDRNRPLQRPGEGSCGFFDEGSAIGALRTRRYND